MQLTLTNSRTHSPCGSNVLRAPDTLSISEGTVGPGAGSWVPLAGRHQESLSQKMFCVRKSDINKIGPHWASSMHAPLTLEVGHPRQRPGSREERGDTLIPYRREKPAWLNQRPAEPATLSSATDDT